MKRTGIDWHGKLKCVGQMLIVALFVCEIEPNRTCVFVADSALLKRAQARFLWGYWQSNHHTRLYNYFFSKTKFFVYRQPIWLGRTGWAGTTSQPSSHHPPPAGLQPSWIGVWSAQRSYHILERMSLCRLHLILLGINYELERIFHQDYNGQINNFTDNSR